MTSNGLWGIVVTGTDRSVFVVSLSVETILSLTTPTKLHVSLLKGTQGYHGGSESNKRNNNNNNLHYFMYMPLHTKPIIRS